MESRPVDSAAAAAAAAGAEVQQGNGSSAAGKRRRGRNPADREYKRLKRSFFFSLFHRLRPRLLVS